MHIDKCNRNIYLTTGKCMTVINLHVYVKAAKPSVIYIIGEGLKVDKYRYALSTFISMASSAVIHICVAKLK